MKKANYFFRLLPVLFFFIYTSASAKEFSGVITYKITYEGEALNDQMKSMMPKTMTLTVKGNKSKVEMITGMGKNINITNGDDHTTITMMDMMGKKFAFNSTSEDIQKDMEGAGDISVEYTNDTKEILGYTCKKAIIHMKGENEGSMTVYYTNELGSKALNFDNPQFKDIDGLMLEYEIVNSNPGFTMHFVATNVEKKKISDKEFDIPEGYEIKTREDMKTMFGGGQ
jgi:GLPGLI family protein